MRVHQVCRFGGDRLLTGCWSLVDSVLTVHQQQKEQWWWGLLFDQVLTWCWLSAYSHMTDLTFGFYWAWTCEKNVVNGMGNLWVSLAVPAPIPVLPLPTTTRVFQWKQAIDHPKWRGIEWVMIKTINLIISHSILNCFRWSGACLKAHGYKNLYPYPWLPVTKTRAIH